MLSPITRIVAIDPGVNGGIIYADLELGRVRVWNVPKAPTGVAGKNQVDPAGVVVIGREMPATPQIWGLEDVFSMPRDGVVSAFTFGEGKGMLRMWLAMQGGIEGQTIVKVSPSVWKRDMGLLADKSIGSEYKRRKEAKERAMALAKRLYRNAGSEQWSEGVCEAALILVWVAAQRRIKMDSATLRPF